MTALSDTTIDYDIELPQNAAIALIVKAYEDLIGKAEAKLAVMQEATNGGVDLYNLETNAGFLLNSIDLTVVFPAGEVDVGSNKVAHIAHGLILGDFVTLTTDGTLPAPLVVGQRYWVPSGGFTSGDFKFALEASRDTAITLTTAGTGTHTATKTNARPFYDTLADAITALKATDAAALYKLSKL